MGAVTLLLLLFIAGIPVILEGLRTVCMGRACEQWQPAPGDLTALHDLGLTIGAWAVSFVVLDALLLLTFCTVATVLVWRNPRDPMARFCAFMLLGLGVNFSLTIGAAGSHTALWWWPVHLTQLLSLVSLIIFFYLFPDGHFVPRWTRWLANCCLVASAVNAFVSWERVVPADIAIPLLCLGIAGLLGSAVVAQVYRYRRVSDLPQRLQTKWATSGFAATILLFDIDILLNRTLVYGLLTARVIGVYVLIVGYLGDLLGRGNNLITSLLAAGLVAVLFQPLRERLQRGVNRLM